MSGATISSIYGYQKRSSTLLRTSNRITHPRTVVGEVVRPTVVILAEEATVAEAVIAVAAVAGDGGEAGARHEIKGMARIGRKPPYHQTLRQSEAALRSDRSSGSEGSSVIDMT